MLRTHAVDEGHYCLLIRARNIPVYKSAKRELEAVLGPSIWHEGKKEAGRYLEFPYSGVPEEYVRLCATTVTCCTTRSMRIEFSDFY